MAGPDQGMGRPWLCLAWRGLGKFFPKKMPGPARADFERSIFFHSHHFASIEQSPSPGNPGLGWPGLAWPGQNNSQILSKIACASLGSFPELPVAPQNLCFSSVWYPGSLDPRALLTALLSQPSPEPKYKNKNTSRSKMVGIFAHFEGPLFLF